MATSTPARVRNPFGNAARGKFFAGVFTRRRCSRLECGRKSKWKRPFQTRVRQRLIFLAPVGGELRNKRSGLFRVSFQAGLHRREGTFHKTEKAPTRLTSGLFVNQTALPFQVVASR
jgi:hypothetical protein